MLVRDILYLIAEDDVGAAKWFGNEIREGRIVWSDTKSTIDNVLHWESTPQGFDFWQAQHIKAAGRGY